MPKKKMLVAKTAAKSGKKICPRVRSAGSSVNRESTPKSGTRSGAPSRSRRLSRQPDIGHPRRLAPAPFSWPSRFKAALLLPDVGERAEAAGDVALAMQKERVGRHPRFNAHQYGLIRQWFDNAADERGLRVSSHPKKEGIYLPKPVVRGYYRPIKLMKVRKPRRFLVVKRNKP